MSKFNLLFLCFFIVTIVPKNNRQTKLPSPETQYEKKKHSFTDTVAFKNKKLLATFSDTSLLERYLAEIESFEKDDYVNSKREVDILFTGSSSIRKWNTLTEDMSNCKILNRGFGGSTIPEVIYYFDVLVLRHKPSKIVLYAGENDISLTNTDTLKVIQSFIYLQELIKQLLPKSQLYFVSIKPSPARWEWWPQVQIINRNIKQFCGSIDNCSFIDVSSKMLTKDGEVNKGIFVKDDLHLNQEGYKIWSKIIGNELKCKVDEGL